MGEIAAIYARVSTHDQDEQRQVRDCRDLLDDHPYEIEDVKIYADVQTGTTTARDDYQRLVDDIRDGAVDLVVATEVSRLSRSGAQDVMEFITHCLEENVGVEFTQSPVTLRPGDDVLTQSIQRLIISLLSELANIEHKQKMDRIQSGIHAAQEAGKWTGRPPRGFTTDEKGYLHVDTAEFLETRNALERVLLGESTQEAADATGIPESTLRAILDDEDRRRMYFYGDHDDDRKQVALDELGNLQPPEIQPDPSEESMSGILEEQIRAVVRDELESGG